jgi:hypothetical protein
MICTDGKEYPVQLNLADLYLQYVGAEEALCEYLQRINCSRVSVGSYFCDIYFRKTAGMLQKSALPYFEAAGVTLTLVVPIIAQEQLVPVKQLLYGLLLAAGNRIDEVTVNDIGMLYYMKSLKAQAVYQGKIIAGRLLFKNFRDSRVEDYSTQMVTMFFPEILEGNVDAAEIEAVSQRMDLSEFPDGILLHVHYPFNYISGGRLCEFAAANNRQNLLLQTQRMCRTTCMKGYLHTGEGKESFFHVGKGVYMKQPPVTQLCGNIERYLYWPLEELMGGVS